MKGWRARILSGFYILAGPLFYSIFNIWGFVAVMVLLFSFFVYLRYGGTASFLTSALAAAYLMAAAATALLTPNVDLAAAAQPPRFVLTIVQMNFVPWAVPIMLLVSRLEGNPDSSEPEQLFATPKSRLSGVIGAAFLGALPAIIAYPYIVSPSAIAQRVNQISEILFRDPQALLAFERQGVSQDLLERQMAAIVKIVLENTPGVEAFIGVCILVVTALLFGIVYRRRSSLRFARWQLPWYTIWGFIFGLALFLAGDLLKIEPARLIGMNLLCCYALVGAVLGLSCLANFYQTLKVTPRTRLFLLIGLCFTFLFLLGSGGPIGLAGGFALVGLFDMVLDFRQLSRGKEEKIS